MKRPRAKNKGLSLTSLVTNQTALCNLPIFILVIVASLDNADKQLLASSFPALEKTLHLSVETLGYFSLFTNLSYALSLPLWGWLVHTYGMAKIHLLLSAACFSWGLSTIGIALSGSSVVGQAVFRAMNGMALGSILPLSQTLLVGMVDVAMRGRAFGWMGLCEKLAGTAAAASVFYFARWEDSYYILGFVSVGMSWIAWKELSPRKRTVARRKTKGTINNNKILPVKENDSDDDDEDDEESTEAPTLTIRQILARIARVPAFACLVAQGIFGGTPWDMMSFMLLLLDWRHFTTEQIVMVQFSTGVTATVGGWMGGLLGDYASSRYQTKGRILVALISVAGGIPFYGIFLFAKDYQSALLFVNLFHFVGTWATAGALRPICADLARSPSERAQIVSLWIVLEKTSGAIFGAPLVGYMTSHMMKLKDGNTDLQNIDDKAHALAWNLFCLSTLFWTICSCFWVAMACTIDKHPHGSSGNKQVELLMHHKDSDLVNVAGSSEDAAEQVRPFLSHPQTA